MKTPKHFDLEELLDSSTARKLSDQNMPSWTIVENLLELALFLDGIREAWGKPVYVSSGFRNEKINKAVGGVATSAHLRGDAADIYVAGGKTAMDKFGEFLVDYLKDKRFDQLLRDKSKSGGYWYHISLKNKDGLQRKQIKDMFVNR